VARNAGEFAAAIEALQAGPGLGRALVEAGRELLRARHDPDSVAERLLAVHGSTIRGGATS
jgi:hypothetical protein